MSEDEAFDSGSMIEMHREGDEFEHANEVVIRPNPVVTVLRVAASIPSIALAALIIATVTMLTVGVADDIGDAKLYGGGETSDLTAIRWTAGSRLVVAGVALVLALIAAARYARTVPGVRFTFSDGDSEPQEALEGAEHPQWQTLLVGTAITVSAIAVILNVVALLITLHTHLSPQFGVPGG